jgi:hypothetical protein
MRRQEDEGDETTDMGDVRRCRRMLPAVDGVEETRPHSRSLPHQLGDVIVLEPRIVGTCHHRIYQLHQ